MSYSKISGVRIAGVASAVPARRAGLAEGSAVFGEESARKVSEATGVIERRIASPEVCTSDLCAAAAELLLKELDRPVSDIGGLIFISQSPDYVLPATSQVLQHRLGLPDSVFAFDVNLGCSGYVYGLWLAASLVSSTARPVLLLVGDTPNKMVSPVDQSTALLFGDAGSATLLEPAAESPPMHFVFGTDGAGAEHLIIPAGGFRQPRTKETATRTARETESNVRGDQDVHMNGAEIFAFTLQRVPKMVKQLLETSGHTIDEADAVVFHQANGFMLEHLRKKLKVPAEKFIVEIGQYGNTSSASIPLAMTVSPSIATLSKATSARLLLGGFGVGFSWGAAWIEISSLSLPALRELA
jgi:3-oxoacyl-[acyl-carrier-protein] synthase-3